MKGSFTYNIENIEEKEKLRIDMQIQSVYDVVVHSVNMVNKKIFCLEFTDDFVSWQKDIVRGKYERDTRNTVCS